MEFKSAGKPPEVSYTTFDNNSRIPGAGWIEFTGPLPFIINYIQMPLENVTDAFLILCNNLTRLSEFALDFTNSPRQFEFFRSSKAS